jgi:hypothetical protein
MRSMTAVCGPFVPAALFGQDVTFINQFNVTIQVSCTNSKSVSRKPGLEETMAVISLAEIPLAFLLNVIMSQDSLRLVWRARWESLQDV